VTSPLFDLPVLASGAILIGAYLLIVFELFSRAIVALLGACLLVMLGVLTQPQALAAIDWDRGPVQTLNGAPIAGCPSGECLVQCPYFNMDRYFFDQQLPNPYSGRLSIWIVFAGSALLATSGNYRRSFRAGETVLIPASAPASSWKTANGPATLLGVSLPS